MTMRVNTITLWGMLLAACLSHSAVEAKGQRVPNPKCSEGKLAVSMDGKWGFIDCRSTQIVIPPQFDWAENFSEGLAPVSQGDQFGYIDASGHVVIPLQYEFADYFSEGLARVCEKAEDGCHGVYINTAGERVMPGVHYAFGSGIFDLSEGLVCISSMEQSGKFGYADRIGRMVIPPTFDVCSRFSEGLAAVRTGDGVKYERGQGGALRCPDGTHQDCVASTKPGRWGYIDKTGAFAIPAQFEHPEEFGAADDFSQGRATVYVGGGYGYIDRTGHVAIKPHFKLAQAFAEGLAAVQDANGLYGYIDKNGDYVMSQKFQYATNFSEGLAAVFDGGGWGYINRTGRYEIPAQFKAAYPFSEGLARVDVGYIDKTGRIVWPRQKEKPTPER